MYICIYIYIYVCIYVFVHTRNSARFPRGFLELLFAPLCFRVNVLHTLMGTPTDLGLLLSSLNYFP